MIIEVKVPSPGESINEVQVAAWLVEDGDFVERDQDIVEIDSDKATLPLAAPADGKIKIVVEEGETIEINTVIAKIDTEVKGPVFDKASADGEVKESASAIPIAIGTVDREAKADDKTAEKSDVDLTISPLARKLMEENAVNENDFVEFFRNHRIGKSEVKYYLENINPPPAPPGRGAYTPFTSAWKGGRNEGT